MRKLSYPGSFLQTSGHIRAGERTNPASWHAHTHAHTHTHKKRSTGSCLSTSTKSAQSQPIPCLPFLFPTLFHAFAHCRGLPAVQSKRTAEQWTFHGSITYRGNKLLHCSVRKSMVPWVHFTNHLLFALHWASFLPEEKKRRKEKKRLRHQAYLQICMHSNSYPELPKLRITQFWIKGERKIIQEKPLLFQLMSFPSHADS